MKKINPFANVIRSARLGGIATAVLISTIGSNAAPVTIYSEDFAGDGSATLIGTAEDTSATPWQGNVGFLNDGSVTINRGPALLPHNPQNGFIYTATIRMDIGVGEVMTFGWGQFIDSVRFHNQSGITGWAWMQTDPVAGQSAYEGPRGIGSDNIADGTNEVTGYEGELKLTIILNTTTPVWTASYFVNDLPFYENMVLDGADSSTLNYIGVAAGLNVDGRLLSFSLTSELSAVAPGLVETSPVDGAPNVLRSGNLVATFDKPIQPGASGVITLHLASDDSVVESFDVTAPAGPLTFDGNQLTINPSSDFLPGAEYHVIIPADAVTDAGSLGFTGITGVGDWSFTADGAAPTTATFGPVVGATGVSVTADLDLAFDEAVQVGSGNIEVYLADGTLVQTIDVASGAVTISGSGVTIDIDDLTPGAAYYVNINSGAFTDLSGNAYAGISDDSSWAFTVTSASVTFIKMTSDEDCGISSSLTYTHAIDFGRGANIPTVNGVQFVDDFNDEIVGVRTNSGSRTYGSSDNNGNTLSTTILTGEISKVVTDIDFRGPDLGTITLTGLTPGETYDLRFYDRTFPFQGGTRRYRLSYDIDSDSMIEHTTPEIDQNDPTQAPISFDGGDAAWITSFVYMAGPEGSITVTVDLNDTDFGMSPSPFTYHLYGLTNNVLSGSNLKLQIAANGDALDFSWNSLEGMQYDLVSSTDLSTPISTWEVYDEDGVGGNEPYENIANAGTTTTLTGVLRNGPTRFFALIEEEVPPLPAIASFNFDAGDGGFTTAGTGTTWSHGIPNSINQGGGAVEADNSGSGSCWATNLTGPYIIPTDSYLRSSSIDLTAVSAADLTFAMSSDLAPGHTYEVNIIEAGTDDVIANIIPATGDDNGSASVWATVGPIGIPASAIGQMVRIEWHFVGPDDDPFYNGVYIDDVVVSGAP